MNELLIYSVNITARLSYITHLVIGNLLGLRYRLTSNAVEFAEYQGPRINYSNRPVSAMECMIVPAGLIDERGINSLVVNITDFAGTKALFPVYSRESSLPFDIFSATFFMVSRYEEYLPYIRDEHGRFSAFSSLAYQKGFLQSPVVNIWSKELGKILQELFPGIPIKYPRYEFIPSIDIDAAWAYKHKGLYRTIGGFIKDLKVTDMAGVKKRYRVLRGHETDPFDSFELMHTLHRKYDLRPLFFILFAGYDQFDKNTSINNHAFRRLITSLGDEGDVGIHPSYASNSDEMLLKQEISGLSEVLHREVTLSRQHFLKLHLPYTYRNLIAEDITDDYTMGFAAKTGFRAGICTPFKWYDLEMERATSLVIHPFAVMDGTLRDYLKVEAEGALSHIVPLIEVVRSVGGTFISLFHNESLSEWKRWKGWSHVYEEMLRAGTK
ncbi:MAG TPA: polysaccharide deacetylase family protein [Lentimicrobium sp.]|nr:polysaccharide deacetylase family protein [Bacteroidales bacterium]HLO89819.1 polysaccharide deacetylase family protein [Lentimicrobium sp.]